MYQRAVPHVTGPAERHRWTSSWHRPTPAVLAAIGTLLVMALVAPGAGAASATRGTANRVGAGTPVDPRLFEPGACMAYAPTSGDRHLTVFLDAGHGGIDPGGVGETESGQTIEEANETLPVELETEGLLRAKGFAVVVSRTRDESVARLTPTDISGGLLTADGVHDDVMARDVCANVAKANVLLGIYFDAGESPLDAGSVTGYDTDRPFSAQNLHLATLVQTDVLGAMNAHGWGIPDLGVVDDSELGGPALTTAAAEYGHLLLLGPAEQGYSTAPSAMPGALIEPLFLTDPYEASLAASASGQQLIAGGLAQAIVQYFARAPTGRNAQAAQPTRHRGGGSPSGQRPT